MLNNLADYQAAVERMVRDGAGVLDAPDYDQFLQDALKRLAKAEPRRVVADIDGDGGFDYLLPEPFDSDWSKVEKVEYPAGRREPSFVDELDWDLYRAPAGPALRFLADTPKAGETLRVTFTAMHSITEDSSTVPAAREDVVKMLAAALACEALASHYSNVGDATIIADSTDHKSKAKEYSERAKRYMALATELLPIPQQGGVQAASGDTTFGEDLSPLTHPSR